MEPQNPAPLTFPKSSKAPLFAAVLGGLFILALIFAVWAYSSRSTIKSSADAKVATAGKTLAQAQADEAAATAANKTPYKTFTGPSTYGSISFNYPKNWSGYVDQTDSNEPLNGYFQPGIVPAAQSPVAFALRVELVDSDYGSVVGQLQPGIQDGSLKASAYLPPKMKKITGAIAGLKLDGVIGQDSAGNSQTGSMVVLKVRDKTLQIYTESLSYLQDFNNILNSLTYKP